MIFSQRRLYEGDVIPWFYGVAWRNFTSNTFTCYIMPFNWVFRWCRDFYWFLAQGPEYQTKIEKMKDEIFQNGYRTGHIQGKRAGEYETLNRIDRIEELIRMKK